MIIDGKRYSFTQPVCTQDWIEDNHEIGPDGGLMLREPMRVKQGDRDYGELVENCCKCGRLTTSQIFIRVDPSTVPYPREDKDDE